jgi:hypothetical protein
MKMHELLSDPARWTQNAIARDSSGATVDPESMHAVCWCLDGAVWKVYGRARYAVLHQLSRNLSPVHKSHEASCVVIDYNDTPGRTWKEVHDLLVKLDL